MATTYPGTINTFTDPSGTAPLATGPDHAQLHTDINDTLEAVQTVMGTTAGTAVLKNLTAGQFVVSDSGTATLTNKTLTSPKINEDVAVTSTATELNLLDGMTRVLFCYYAFPGGLNGFSTSSTTDVLVTTALFGDITSVLLSDIPAGRTLYIKLACRANITSGRNGVFSLSGTGITKADVLTCAGTGGNVNYASAWAAATSFTDGADWQINARVTGGAGTITGGNKLAIALAWG